jgi:hypothetical protein
VQLQRNLDQFKKAGISVFAISYDPVGAQKAFADEAGITFPLLSDEKHEAIEATGILNTLVRPDEEMIYGVPFPGSYMVERDGTVEEKLFFQHYRTRPSAATVLRNGFGLDFEIRKNPRAEATGEGLRITATMGGESMVFMETSTLYVDIDLNEGLHLYGQPIPEGYIATEVTVSGPERVNIGDVQYPATAPFRVSGIDAEFQVFEGDVRIAVPVQSALAEGDSFALDVSVKYQACTDVACYLPQTRELHLDIPIEPLNMPPRRG